MMTSSHDSKYMRALTVAAFSVAAANAFTASGSAKSSSTALKVAVDPTVVSKKEFEDICGVGFGPDSLHERLKATNFLYPKHVEVIEDIAPIAGAMVDEIVSKIR
jgi:hypothetical protein